MSSKEIFICLAVMFFLGYLVGRQIERHCTKIIFDEIQNNLNELLNTIEKNKEKRMKELDNLLAQDMDKFRRDLLEHEYKHKEESDD